MRKAGKFEVGEAETPIKYTMMEDLDTGKNVVMLTFGYPHEERAWFDKERLDDFIDKLKNVRVKMESVVG
jgi:hypothetical protein